MSSPYPVLNNRPIDQWKVTELKDELKRRKLITRGLKDDLIRRLDEALRVEEENSKKNANNSFDSDHQPLTGEKNAGVMHDVETSKDVDDDNKNGKVDKVTVPVAVEDSTGDLGPVKVQAGEKPGGNDAIRVEETLNVEETAVDSSVVFTETVVSEVTLSEQDLPIIEIQKDYEDSKSQIENEYSKHQLENEYSKHQLENEDSKHLLENEDSKLHENEDSKPLSENEGLKASNEDLILDSTATNNQVSEVSLVLGSQVKSDSISTHSVTINENIELKDNIIADNVKLELDVSKLEMVHPSASNVDPVCGESHPMDVEEPHETMLSVEERDDYSTVNEDTGKKNDSADLGYSEKLNLDRSSGEDSMEEDVLEGKQIDSNDNTSEVRVRSEKNVVFDTKEETHVDIVGDDLSVEMMDVRPEVKNLMVMPSEKRRLHDREAFESNEPLKKQRRWNSENIKVPEPLGSNLTPTITPKDEFQSTSLKRSISRADSTISEDSPKERVVPPSQKPPTSSLRIDHFLRPFTLKAVQELLGKTGSVTSFWMDQIKTHCYVTYPSSEEAIQTRNAVYNLRWPPNGGRLLLAEFVDPEEVKMRVKSPPLAPSTPVGTSTTVPSAPTSSLPQPSPRQLVSRQQLPLPPSLPPPPPLSNPAPVRERLPPPPPLPEKSDPPIVTLDDLFRKTKATPRIYYLPLSEEQVAAKAVVRARSSKQ